VLFVALSRKSTVIQLHELMTVAVLGLAVGGYVALVVGFGLVGALFGAALYLSVAVLVAVALPHTPASWTFPTLLPRRAQRWLAEERERTDRRV